MPRETEIKLRVPSVEHARRLLRRSGFRTLRRRIFEVNLVLDTNPSRLRVNGVLLRLRQVGRESILTYKGVAIPGKHKSREELELSISDAAALLTVFGRLGYHPIFRYEKFRTEYKRSREAGIAMLDETPIGVFLELEGSPLWIDRSARRLGFAEADYITASYGTLYLEHRRARPSASADMVFAHIAERK